MMGALLIDGTPMVYQPALAAAIGLPQAVVLQQIHYWTNPQDKRATKHHDGFDWVYKTNAELGQEVGLTKTQTQRAVAKLKDLGLLISIRNPYYAGDNRLWFRVDHELVSEVGECESALGQCNIASTPCKSAPTLPETTAETTNQKLHTDITQTVGLDNREYRKRRNPEDLLENSSVPDALRQLDNLAKLKARSLQRQYADLLVSNELDDAKFCSRNIKRSDWHEAFQQLVFEFPALVTNSDALEIAFARAVEEAEDRDSDSQIKALSSARSPFHFRDWLLTHPVDLSAVKPTLTAA
jgi:hypothetical protein